jgi:hypothetical protein
MGVKVAAGVQVAGAGVAVDVTAAMALRPGTCGVGEAGAAHATSSNVMDKTIVV